MNNNLQYEKMVSGYQTIDTAETIDTVETAETAYAGSAGIGTGYYQMTGIAEKYSGTGMDMYSDNTTLQRFLMEDRVRKLAWSYRIDTPFLADLASSYRRARNELGLKTHSVQSVMKENAQGTTAGVSGDIGTSVCVRPVPAPYNMHLREISEDEDWTYDWRDHIEDLIHDREKFMKQLKLNIEYEILKSNQNYDIKKLDWLVDLMTGKVCSGKRSIRFGRDVHPVEEVAKYFLSLNSLHIDYVIEFMNDCRVEIQNANNYYAAVLYNAPITMDNYYTQFYKDHKKR